MARSTLTPAFTGQYLSRGFACAFDGVRPHICKGYVTHEERDPEEGSWIGVCQVHCQSIAKNCDWGEKIK